MKIIRRDYGQGSGKEEQKLNDDELLLDRLIYRKMGSLTDNKVLQSPTSDDSDFHRWLRDMNAYHNKIYYPGLTAGDPEPTPDLVALDEYLGSLGITEIYPFSQDTYKVESWITTESQPEYRVLTDKTDNTYLTDSSGTEVLVSYTGV